MAEKKKIGISKNSLVLYGICLAGLLAIIFLGNLQVKNMTDDLIVKIGETRNEIKRQEALYPLYTRLRAEAEREVLNELQLVETVPMRQDEVDKATDLIDRMATLSGMQATEIQPDPSSLADDPNQLLVNMDLAGDFFGFREFMKRLGAIQYVKHIEQIVVQEAASGQLFNLKVRLAVLSGNATQGAGAAE